MITTNLHNTKIPFNSNLDILNLPDELIFEILQYLRNSDLNTLRSTSKNWCTFIEANAKRLYPNDEHKIKMLFAELCSHSNNINMYTTRRKKPNVIQKLTAIKELSDNEKEEKLTLVEIKIEKEILQIEPPSRSPFINLIKSIFKSFNYKNKKAQVDLKLSKKDSEIYSPILKEWKLIENIFIKIHDIQKQNPNMNISPKLKELVIPKEDPNDGDPFSGLICGKI